MAVDAAPLHRPAGRCKAQTATRGTAGRGNARDGTCVQLSGRLAPFSAFAGKLAGFGFLIGDFAGAFGRLLMSAHHGVTHRLGLAGRFRASEPACLTAADAVLANALRLHANSR